MAMDKHIYITMAGLPGKMARLVAETIKKRNDIYDFFEPGVPRDLLGPNIRVNYTGSGNAFLIVSRTPASSSAAVGISGTLRAIYFYYGCRFKGRFLHERH